MRAQGRTTSGPVGKKDNWFPLHLSTINRNKGIDLLPKRGNMPILKRIKLWWTE